jgi:hypothetical protein
MSAYPQRRRGTPSDSVRAATPNVQRRPNAKGGGDSALAPRMLRACKLGQACRAPEADMQVPSEIFQHEATTDNVVGD